ncbi:oxygenase MpaB family protein [Massilia sp. Leaf139]|uniref:oxygenase MpaB family protein n=1 Tax=Massilia sp. Leaf139 TaxID=1736272 RepID=UPI0006FB3D70|nr:oxygenase MpaB family protein [Massilia sp. Leaf139]KQQ91858.1 hypothetical protein ASF77_07975 [Massilia sp. Leaf139]
MRELSKDIIDPAAADPRLRADPLADLAISRILGAWRDGTPSVTRWEAVALVERALAGWDSNGALASWRADAATPAPIAAALEDYVRAARQLPAWLDAGKIGCAEGVFAEAGMLAPTLLACAILPELDAAVDPLAQPADERLRAAASLLFAALLPGGLLEPGGAGLAQLLRLRLTHALIRHLVVRGNPAEALAHGAAVPALRPEGDERYRTLFARGWDVRANGLPRNQEELAYWLLTWQHVFPHGLRRLGAPLARQEAGAWLHAWNVIGYLLGIEEALLTASAKEAAASFARMQQVARAGAEARYAGPARKGTAPAFGKAIDPRPAMGAALERMLQDERGSAAFPLLLARRLCTPASLRALGLDGRPPLRARLLFALARAADTVTRPLSRRWSLLRLGARVLGHRLAQRFLADPARPLDLPEAQRRQLDDTVNDWERDAQAPRWLHAIERRWRMRRSGRGGEARA